MEKGCKRGGKGFSTTNDLDRHKKSVHGIGVTYSKSYRCAADGCQNKHKVWPRLDNFKQHIDRMHKEEDQFGLLKRQVVPMRPLQNFPDTYRSEFFPQDSQTSAQLVAVVDPSHLLAGMDSQSALATVDASGNSLSASMQGYAYPQHMSISGQSLSGPSQVSPTTQTSDTSFSQTAMSSFGLISNSSTTALSFPQPDTTATGRASDRKYSSRLSTTGRVAKPTAVRGPKLSAGTVLGLCLSSAPQTKSEQQKQQLDIDKLSRARLQEILRRVLDSQQHDDDSTGIEARSAVQRQAKHPRSPERSAIQSSTSSVQQRCPMDDCSFMGRTCDLNKHLKRHVRPYGCTYPKCFKKFGAKSDWKRHENSQHFQQEVFRCDLLDSDKTCGQHYHRAAQFRNHLKHEHKPVSTDEMQIIVDRCKIGKNCQGQYWCGFCCKIKALKTRRNHAWDERFDHIAHHFEKDDPKKHIDDWICVEENRTKKELKEEMKGDETEKNARGENCDGDAFSAALEPMPSHGESTPSPQDSYLTGPRKRQLSLDLPRAQPPAKRRILTKYCVSVSSLKYRMSANSVVPMWRWTLD
jgi:hypothetical protein